ncbi:peptidase S8/S53 domain-containing protein [Fennellomyces sp. T-0311]|nr:peptidase S8/S53 domain-containing protein [Fennellomyces sp. T-0311]
MVTNILGAIAKTGLVANVYPVRAIEPPNIVASIAHSSADVHMLLPHAQTQVDRVHDELKNTGTGIKVGIIDSGVDYMHPALGGGFGPGFKVAMGRDLVGDDFNEQEGVPPKPDSDPIDSCPPGSGASGHGTHVSGIIAGRTDAFTGVAPDAILGMWRVFPCNGSTSDDILIDAILDAYDAGVDIINMSLGSNTGWPESPTAVVAARITAKGVPVIIAAGNEGTSGAFTVGSPSVGQGAFSVASFDNDRTLTLYFTMNNSPEKYGYTPSTPDTGDIPSAQIVAGDVNVSSATDACDPKNIPSTVKGKLALVQRGTCTFDDKAINLQQAGAIGVVIYNTNGQGALGISVPTAKVPTVGIAHDTGIAILSAIQNSQVTLTFSKEQVVSPVPSGNTVSSFSSIGASYEIDVKPNIAGVGGYIYSTLPRQFGSWGMMSGTSMATPYVAGATALYLKAMEGNAKPTPEYILEQFQNYAYQAPHANNEINVDTPYRQGAGLIQVYDTIQQKVHITPGDISFNDTANMQKTHTLTVANSGNTIASYEVINNVSVSVVPYNLDESVYFNEPATFGQDAADLVFSKRVLRILPGSSIDITVTVNPPNTDPKLHIMYGGFIKFKDLLSQRDLTVPYIGIVGNQHELPIFGNDTPFISNVTESPFPVFGPDDVFTFEKSKPETGPYFIISLPNPTRTILSPLYNDKGVQLGHAFTDLDYLGRSTSTQMYINYQWNGTYTPTLLGLKIPISVQANPGRYRIGFQALKWLGDPNSKDDWERWTSCIIEVQ